MNIVERDILAHLAIVLALCIGAWMMMVEPTVRAIADERGFLADVRRSGLADLDDSSLHQITSYIDTVRSTVAQVHDRSAFAHDTTGVYSSIMVLADSNGVEVDRITPGTASNVADAAVSVKTADVAVRGAYADVAAFLGALDHLEGFVRVDRVVLGTIDTEAGILIEATATCDLLSVNLPPALAAMISEDRP